MAANTKTFDIQLKEVKKQLADAIQKLASTNEKITEREISLAAKNNELAFAK